MTIYLYFSLFLILLYSFISLEIKKINSDRNSIFIFLSILLTLISSFRWKVGGDWESYLYVFESTGYTNFQFEWSLTFELLNYFFSYIEGGIYGVNLFIAAIFFLALYRLGKVLNFDLILLLLISFSLVYFNGVMGYVRQTFCLTFLILATEFLVRKKNYKSTAFFILSITTHISAIIFAPIFLFIHFKKLKSIVFIIFILSLVIIISSNTLAVAFEQFVRIRRNSLGSMFRAIPLIMCCFIYLKYRKEIITSTRNFNFLVDYLFGMSILMSFITFLFPSFSTISDRLSFYLIIFQIIILGQFFKKVIKKDNRKYIHTVIFVSVSYFILTLAWLMFGNYSIFWLDYNFLYIK